MFCVEFLWSQSPQTGQWYSNEIVLNVKLEATWYGLNPLKRVSGILILISKGNIYILKDVSIPSNGSVVF